MTQDPIAALAAELNIMRRTGKVCMVAEVAEEYNLVDRDGEQEHPVSLRSLQFLQSFD
ncbi:hypothetical protein [Myxosarcina sp. GI1(2024)]